MRPTNRVHERPARHIRGAASRHAQQQPRRERLVVKRAVDVARRRPTLRSVLAPETLVRWAPTPQQEDGPAEDRHSLKGSPPSPARLTARSAVDTPSDNPPQQPQQQPPRKPARWGTGRIQRAMEDMWSSVLTLEEEDQLSQVTMAGWSSLYGDIRLVNPSEAIERDVLNVRTLLQVMQNTLLDLTEGRRRR
ncbi:hypothetical protein BC940DRAFT_356514 [Gongronella butleri]|nr:hypothetical protein BC940DRAFT_356514 [Gongronella butleri]